MKKTSWKKWLAGFGTIIILLVLLGFLFLQFNTYEASKEATDLLSDEGVSQGDDWLTVISDEIDGQIVFYQGGLVEPAAYLPLAKALSEENFQVFIPQMPLNLAILDMDVIDEIIAANPSDKDWWLAGHSLGGTSATIYAKENPDDIEGIILLAGYPNENSDLSDLNLPILSITSTNDKVINDENYEKSKSLLPEKTSYKEIEGGNHSNFGYYGLQDGDGRSILSRTEQQNLVVHYIKTFIDHSR